MSNTDVYNARYAVRSNVGKSLVFDGSTSYAVVPITPSVNGFCVAFRVYIGAANTADGSWFLNANSTVNNDGFDIYFANGTRFWARVFNGATATVNAGTIGNTAKPHTWHHVCLVYYPNNTSFYVDGKLIFNDTSAQMSSPSTFQIGRRLAAHYGNFDLSELVFENTTTPWTDAQVKALCFRGVLPNNTAKYWNFNDVATDQNGANELTTNNTVYSSNVYMTTRTAATTRFQVEDFETALFFAGTSISIADNVTVVPNAAIKAATSFTLSLWVRPELSQISQGGRIFDLNVEGGANVMRLQSVSSGDNLAFLIVNTPILNSSNRLLVNRWNHILARYDAATNTAKIDINGTNVVTDTTSVSGNLDWSAADTLKVGNNNSANSRPYHGAVDEVRLWNRYFSDTEAAKAYRLIRPSTSPLLELLFNEGSGEVANDTSGNGLNGTVSGATYTTAVAFAARTLV